MMRDQYRGGSYRPLSDRDVERIHEASEKILADVGFEISFPPIMDCLEQHGARVDRQSKRVYLPRKLVTRFLKQAPEEFVYYGLEEGREITVGRGRVHFGTGGKALYVQDVNNRRRPALLEDIVRFGRLADQLDHVDFFIIPVQPHDVNIHAQDITEFYAALCATGKPVMGGVFSKKGLHDTIEMAALLAGGLKPLQDKPFVGFITSIASPLALEDDRAELLWEIARHGLPLVVSTAPIAGATAPVTLAGTLAQQNAEALMGIVLSQVVNPGAPVFYSAVPCTMDMRYGSFLMGSIESGLMNAAIAQMAHFYRVPCYITVGVTDSKTPDAQAAYESATTSMLAALAGGDFIHQAFGFLDGSLTISYGQFMIDHDIVGSCLRTLKGIEVSPETLALDVIARVGPRGNFLAEQHTIEHMRDERYVPRVSHCLDYQNWLDTGGTSSGERAESIAAQMTDEPAAPYVSDAMKEKIFARFPVLRDAECHETNGKGEQHD